jgi:hypothetical protein
MVITTAASRIRDLNSNECPLLAGPLQKVILTLNKTPDITLATIPNAAPCGMSLENPLKKETPSNEGETRQPM